MEKNSLVQEYWAHFLAALQPGQPRPENYTAWYFGDSPELADKLTALVLAGTKTATAGLLWSYQAENEPLPRAGDYSVITTFDGQPVAVVETIRAYTVPFDQVDAEQAYLEGEDDRTLDSWRAGHWRFFSRECAALGREPSADMPVVCERFRLVSPLPEPK